MATNLEQFEAELVAMERKTSHLTISMPVPQVMALITVIQVALRDPTTARTAMGQDVRKLAWELQKQFPTECQTVHAVLRAGWELTVQGPPEPPEESVIIKLP